MHVATFGVGRVRDALSGMEAAAGAWMFRFLASAAIFQGHGAIAENCARNCWCCSADIYDLVTAFVIRPVRHGAYTVRGNSITWSMGKAKLRQTRTASISSLFSSPVDSRQAPTSGF